MGLGGASGSEVTNEDVGSNTDMRAKEIVNRISVDVGGFQPAEKIS